MLGQTRYPRTERDFYPTPARATEAFVNVCKPMFADRVVAEPACGDGAICKVLEWHVAKMIGTDIHAYEGYDPTAMIDFLNVASYEEYCEAVGDRPTAMITNPPYGDLAEAFAWKSIELMEGCGGMVAMLCRHEWDAAKGRGPLFDHPSFAAKVTLRFRPRWIADSKGAPRFAYAWYVWDWSKDPSAPAKSLYAE